MKVTRKNISRGLNGQMNFQFSSMWHYNNIYRECLFRSLATWVSYFLHCILLSNKPSIVLPLCSPSVGLRSHCHSPPVTFMLTTKKTPAVWFDFFFFKMLHIKKRVTYSHITDSSINYQIIFEVKSLTLTILMFRFPETICSIILQHTSFLCDIAHLLDPLFVITIQDGYCPWHTDN